LTLDLDARALDGVTAALEKFAPQTADRLRRSAGRLTPLVLRATLAVDPSATGAAAANGKFKIVGRAGAFRVALEGDAGAAGDALKLDNLAALAGAKVNVSGRLDGDDGAALVELMGLDRFVVADKRPGRLTLTAKGPLDGELAIDGQLAAGSLNIATNGTLRLAGSASPSAALNLKVANANLRSPRPAAAGAGAGGAAHIRERAAHMDRRHPRFLRHHRNDGGQHDRRAPRHRTAAATDLDRRRPRCRRGGFFRPQSPSRSDCRRRAPAQASAPLQPPAGVRSGRGRRSRSRRCHA
jgi:hypothetical protein